MKAERTLIGWKAAVNDRKIASLRYRVETPVRALQALGHAVEVFDPEREAEYDVVIFAKTYSLQDRALAGRVRARGGRVVFDLCDNHFYNPKNVPKYQQVREELLDMLSLAQQVVCTTPLLADIVRQEAPWAAEPIIIGDAVEHVEPAEPSLEPFAGTRLLWFGSQGSPNAPAGILDILTVKDHLLEAATRGPVELVVCSNSLEKYEELIAPLPLPTRYIPWTLQGFNGVLASSDGAIIPISPNPFTSCKTHNRLTTALDGAVPVIADSIDSYLEFAPFCTLDDWPGGLRRLMEDPAGERARAAAGRDYLRQHWNSEVLALQWQDALGLTAEASVHAPAALTAPAEPPIAQPRAVPVGAGFLCQGALDRRGADAVTGWVRALPPRQEQLVVRLFRDGVEVAACVADQPREDLRSAGFASANCGFVLPAALEAPGAHFEVRVDGTDWRFQEAAFHLNGDLRHGFRLVPDDAPGVEPVRSFAPSTAVSGDVAGRASAALQVQGELLEQLSSLNELMENARQAAARLVVAAGDDVALGQRLLGLFSENLTPQLRRVVSWNESAESSAAPLN
jgi:hypothetical protein